MSIKKVVKYSFIIMAFIISVIAFINTIVIYQIKENNHTKILINELVSMQEKMNELLKDTTQVNSIDELELKKQEFSKFELNFEKIRENFIEKDSKDFVDIFISDIHENKVISQKLEQLYESEKQIEKAFDTIYELEKENINLENQFEKDYPLENDIRKSLDLKIQELKDDELYRLFSDIKYYSKETLYQYRDEKTLNKWLEKIDLFKEKYNHKEIDDYKQIVSKVGNYIVLLKDIEDKEIFLGNKIIEVINQNKVYSSQIESKITELSSNFINITYFSILFLLVVIIGFIVIIGYKVYKNIGLSVNTLIQN